MLNCSCHLCGGKNSQLQHLASSHDHCLNEQTQDCCQTNSLRTFCRAGTACALKCFADLSVLDCTKVDYCNTSRCGSTLLPATLFPRSLAIPFMGIARQTIMEKIPHINLDFRCRRCTGRRVYSMPNPTQYRARTPRQVLREI